MVRPTLAVEVTPRGLPFALIGVGVAALPFQVAVSAYVAAVMGLAAFLITFEARIRLA
ncbi:hypothetical protein IQ279_03395 [Streptomyces verrucosisporus]|uniref:hypothetical protein n=1 Tax=Streptomyces verrucosisporus TaxID=1695161 RepID=UPI0019D00071|nr:hypothetical protein [Streptomyces verrucosisporus]MBN3928699.1 hypothetical protein [Streptomyces verrucosisporus]